MRRFRCLGNNKDGSRCKNMFLVSQHNQELTCSKHSAQHVSYQYSKVKTACPLHDIAKLIAQEIDDPATFNSFAKISLSTAKACSKLQKEKKKQFGKPFVFDGLVIQNVIELPNGTMFKLEDM